MPQIDGWYYPEDGANYTLVGCPRKDCEEAARAFSWDGPWERIGPHYTLIAEASTQRFRRSMRQYVAEHAGDPGVDEMAAFIAKRWPKRD
ncbi:MAG: hypothetical protein H6674_00935 [Dehalococcoidia bacterium]|nr:hypothetical protein [Dehalococcoidia bacterium]